MLVSKNASRQGSGNVLIYYDPRSNDDTKLIE